MFFRKEHSAKADMYHRSVVRGGCFIEAMSIWS